MEEKVCVICDQTFTPKYRRDRTYCSKECYKKSPKSIVGYTEFRQLIMKRDKDMCIMCRAKDGLELHHMKSTIDGGSDMPSNLITLCHDCHIKLHKELRLMRKRSKSNDHV